MPNKYETGDRSRVIKSMVEYAIRDQEALIDAHMDGSGHVMKGYEDFVEEIEATIRDIKRLSMSLK